MERGRHWSRRGKHDGSGTWRGAAKNLLVGHVQQEVMMTEKIRPEDWNGGRSQLKWPFETTGTKT